MKHIIIRILANCAALWVASYLVAGFVINGGIKEYLFAGIALGLLNLVVKPILTVVAFPLIILSLGLFTFVINAGMLLILTYIFTFVDIRGLISLALATVVVSLVNLVISHKL